MIFSNKKANYFTILLPVLAALLVYINSINAPFQYDDYDTIMQNKDIRILSDLKTIFTHSLFRPVLFFTFAINYYMSGLNPISYHIVNILLHILNVILVFFISHQLFTYLTDENNSKLFAFISSMLFAVHPIGTEAVTYISSRSSVLATFFFLISIHIYLHSVFLENKTKRFILYFLMLLSFFLGAGSKEIILTLPLIIVVLDIFTLKLNLKDTIKRIFSTHLPFVIIILIGIIVRIYIFLNYEKVGGGLPRSVYENLLTQSEVIIKYIRLLLLPFGQNLIHNYPTVRSILNVYTLLSIFTILLLIKFALQNIRSNPVISFGILWFFITLLPSSSFIPFQEAMTEKHLYLPMFGFFLVISQFFIKLLKKFEEYRPYLKALYISIFLILSILTIYRNYIWGDSIRLWEDIIKKTPDSWATHYAYADALRKQAENDFVNSYNSFVVGDIGISQEYMNRYTSNLLKAIKHYTESAILRPAYVDAFLNAGICFGMLYQATKSQNDLKEAERFFRIVKEIDPPNIKALNNLANIFLLEGKYKDAMDIYQEVLKSDPNNINALTNISQIYFNIEKDFERAKETFLRLLEIYRYNREFEKVKEIEDILQKIK